MSTKFAAWLHVTPSPTTLAESSAVYQALSKHGRISAFIRSKHAREGLKADRDASSTFYTVFPHEPSTLQKTFDVPVYHNLPSARDEDPFNIRGLQSRKPMPAPKTFTCVLEVANRHEVKFQEEAMVTENSYHGSFMVKKKDWLQDVLVETNAPPGVSKGCANRTTGEENVGTPINHPEEKKHPDEGAKRKINMRSLLEMWQEVSGSRRAEQERRGSLQDKKRTFKGVSGSRMALNADVPLGISYFTDEESNKGH